MKGFSLIEVLVVIVIILIISSIILAYNRNTEVNILIQTEKNKLKALLNQAKNLALEKRNINAGQVCGFGVNIKKQSNYYTLTLFSDINCDKLLNASDTYLQIFNLNPKIIFKDKNNNHLFEKNILFTGPYLAVWNDGEILSNDLTLFLSNSNDENVKGVIRINSIGSISIFE